MKTKSLIDRKIIERIIPVQEFNKGKYDQDICNKSYGFVMPLYHGFDWKRTKKALIEKYT